MVSFKWVTKNFPYKVKRFQAAVAKHKNITGPGSLCVTAGLAATAQAKSLALYFSFIFKIKTVNRSVLSFTLSLNSEWCWALRLVADIIAIVEGTSVV